MQQVFPISIKSRCNPFSRQRHATIGILLLVFWSLIHTGMVGAAATEQDASSEQTSPRVLVRVLLQEAGLMELLNQIPLLIEQEMNNLKAAAVPFSGDELSRLRVELERRLSVSGLTRQISEQVWREFDGTDLRQVRLLLQQPDALRFKQLQSAMDTEEIRQEVRNYRAKVRDRTPRGQRVDMIDALDQALGHSRIEQDLRVELRKNLLASVSWMKSHEVINEAVLERELAQYRARVAEQITQDARVYFLFMFKHTPSEDLQVLLNAFDSPLFSRFMAASNRAILDAFRNARLKSISELDVARGP